QESRRRQADRARDLRQEPSGAGRRHQGPRPRAVVEQLYRTPLGLSVLTHGALGPLQPPGKAPRVRCQPFSRRLVVGPGQGRQGRAAPMAAPRKPLSRRRVLVPSAGAMVAPALLRGPRAAVAADEVETHGLSGFGELKYPADFKRFDYVNPDAPK